MAVNPIQFLVAQNASITDGTKTITVSGNVDCSRVFSGTAVFLGGADNPAEAVSGTSPNGSGVSTITLRNNWSQGDIVNQQLVSFNTNEGLAEAISNVREIVSNVSAIEDLATQGLIKRISDNQYEVVNISAIGESLITANDASSQRSVLGLGSAATRDIITSSQDTITGRALVSDAVLGYRGLGGIDLDSYPNTDLNTLTGVSTGWYGGFGNVSTSDNYPITANSCNFIILVEFERSGSCKQTIHFTRTNSVRADDTYVRNSYDNTWLPWQEIYHSGNSVNPLDYGLGVPTSAASLITDFGVNLPSGFYRSLGGYTDSPETPTFNSSVMAYPASTGTNFIYQRNVSTPQDIKAWLGCTRPQTGDVAWVEVYHSGNTNFNEYGGVAANDWLMEGEIVSSTGFCAFSAHINSPTPVTGSSTTGQFSILNRLTGAVIASGVTSFIASSVSSNKLLRLTYTLPTGSYQAGTPLVIATETASSKITVNF